MTLTLTNLENIIECIVYLLLLHSVCVGRAAGAAGRVLCVVPVYVDMFASSSLYVPMFRTVFAVDSAAISTHYALPTTLRRAIRTVYYSKHSTEHRNIQAGAREHVDVHGDNTQHTPRCTGCATHTDTTP